MFKKLFGWFIVSYRNYEYVKKPSIYEKIDKVLRRTTVFVDGKNKIDYFAGDCTVWNKSDEHGNIYSKCNAKTQFELYYAWSELKNCKSVSMFRDGTYTYDYRK